MPCSRYIVSQENQASILPSSVMEGSDLEKLYELINTQSGYVLCFTVILVITACYCCRRSFKREGKKPKFVPYKVVKSFSSERDDKKRVCAVVGGTGFIGRNLINELLRRKKYHVFVLGRTFRPERTNPNADCLIQVDMLDLDGLTSAFQGVDSVIHSAIFVPTAYSAPDEIYDKNYSGATNIIKAAQKVGVKNLIFISALIPDDLPGHSAFGAAFHKATVAMEKAFNEANGKNCMHTCIIALPTVIGPNYERFDSLIRGDPWPQFKNMMSFLSIENTTFAIANAEEKLSVQDGTKNQLAGRKLYLKGEVMSPNEFINLPSWPQKIPGINPFVFRAIVKINMMCVGLFNWAPFGPDVNPLWLGLSECDITYIPEEVVRESYAVIDMGPLNPPMIEYIKQIVEKHNAKE